MSLEYTEHMNEKDLHRNLPSVRDIRTLLLHCSSVTPNQQLKQSFQTFAAPPVDETTQQTSQTRTAVQNELSVGPDRSRAIVKVFFKSLILTAVSRDDSVVDPWMQATRYGRVDLEGRRKEECKEKRRKGEKEKRRKGEKREERGERREEERQVCCTSDSLLSGAVTSLGGRAVQHSHWNGFDITTKAGTDKLKEDLLEKKPRVVWMTPPCTTQGAQQSQSRSRFRRIQMNILVVFLWLVKQDWCEAILEQMWGSTSLGRGGAFSELKEQFHSGRTPACQWGNLADGTLSSKSWYAHIDVGQICCVPGDVFMIILIKLW